MPASGDMGVWEGSRSPGQLTAASLAVSSLPGSGLLSSSTASQQRTNGVGQEDNTNATQKTDSKLRTTSWCGGSTARDAGQPFASHPWARDETWTRAQDKMKKWTPGFVSPQKNTYIYRPLPFPPPSKTLSTQDREEESRNTTLH